MFNQSIITYVLLFISIVLFVFYVLSSITNLKSDISLLNQINNFCFTHHKIPSKINEIFNITRTTYEVEDIKSIVEDLKGRIEDLENIHSKEKKVLETIQDLSEGELYETLKEKYGSD